MKNQSLRPSQFITTYGVGSILEGPTGPRIIPTLERSDLFVQRPPGDFQITDLRLSKTLLNNASIVRLPSNAELNRNDSEYIYNTFPFPMWSLCVKHSILYQKLPNQLGGCPQCGLQDRWENWDKARREAIRFVRACKKGHLDDVDWPRLIDHDCNPSYLLWEGGGGALRNVNIRCPICRQTVNLGTAYNIGWSCSGRFPETGTDRPGCQEKSKIIQRGAANLRIPELVSALTIPQISTQLHLILSRVQIVTAIVFAKPKSKQEVLSAIDDLIRLGLVSSVVRTEIDSHSETEILRSIEDVLNVASQPSSPTTLRLDEFKELRRAATYGAPPQPSPTPGAPDLFEVVQSEVAEFAGPKSLKFRITPLSRLRVVMVQTGYRRLDPLEGELVLRSYFDNSRQEWYPGVELFGEGIFIDLKPQSGDPNALVPHPTLSGPEQDAWLQAWLNPNEDRQRFGTVVETNQFHPVFVWWHTLAHRLINALSIDSGYSSAAIRERVYIEIDNGTVSGGVLLYTAQPGGDGTLGGLIALVPQFDRILWTAFRYIDSCSNDPLCEEEVFGPGKYNGAACYACQLISETSCEHRNMYLDRNLLRKNLP